MTSPPEPIWPVGAATGIGSLPGTDIDDAVRLVFGELPDLPHLPELPARGAGADMVGRAGAVLAELHVDLQPSGWRLLPGGAGAGRDENAAADFLARDLDALQAAAFDYAGPLKVQITGPWTLAAALELPRGGTVLLDAGAARDVSEALTEGLLVHLEQVRRRVPAARIVVQLDEPSLPAVLAGRIPTPSGFSTAPAVEEPVAAERLAAVLTAVRSGSSTTGPVLAGVHCCASRPPLRTLARAAVDFLAFDGAATLDLDAIGEAVEAGTRLVVGVVPGTDPTDPAVVAGMSDPSRTVEPARRLWRRLGFRPETLGEVVAVSPSCGLAGASPAYVRTALAAVGRAARLLVDEPA